MLEAASKKSDFLFPQRIQYNISQNGAALAKCTLLYTNNSNKEGISILRLMEFQGMGRTSDDQLVTYMYKKNASVYADFLTKPGGQKVYEIRLKEGMTFDLKKENVFIYKELAGAQMQTELFTQYPVISLQSSFFVASMRVGNGTHKTNKKYNLLWDKSTKIAQMNYKGTGTSNYKNKDVPVEILSISVRGVEIFLLKIFRDKDGYCFPVSITLFNDKDTVEMKVHQVTKA
jgi:hypothetical protein